MHEFLNRLRYYFRRREFEAEMEEEMQHHRSLSGDKRFGNVARIKEDTRAVWGWTLLEQFAQDLRYALRSMIKNPLFTSLAVLSLALGLGANTAIFSFMDAILLRSLPVVAPESLVMLKWRGQNSGAMGMMTSTNGGSSVNGVETASVFTRPMLDQFAKRDDVFSSVFAYMKAEDRNLVVNGDAGLANAVYVSGDYFRGLGIGPAAGRLLVADDDMAGSDPVALVSHGYAQARFGTPEQAVGAPITVDRKAFRVVGVTPPHFFGVDPEGVPDVYLPLHTQPYGIAMASQAKYANFYWLEVMGRLQPGVSRTEAHARLQPLFQQLVDESISKDAPQRQIPELLVLDGDRGLDSLRNRYSEPLLLLMAMAGLILAIACANLANLLLARAAARTKEMAVRLGIGAGRLRMVRQLLTESVVLSALGAALGLAFALWGMRALTVLLANGQEDFTLRAQLNWHVLALAAGLAVLTGLVFGLAPALQATRVDVMPALKEMRTGGRTRKRRLPTVGQTLMVAQIAFSLLLLVGAGLFARTLSSLHAVELGFNSKNLLLIQVNAQQAGYQGDSLVRFYDDLHQRLMSLPGVPSMSLSLISPLGGGSFNFAIEVPGSLAREERLTAAFLSVGAGYFKTLEIPVLSGREVQRSDQPGAPRVAVVNRRFVREHYGTESAVGRRLRIQGNEWEIVGVTADAYFGTVKTEIRPMVYLPYGQGPFLNQMTYILRTTGDPMALGSTVREIVRQMNPLVLVPHVLTQQRQIDRLFNQEIVFARLCSAFAMLALVVACVGLYATMSYNVAHRTGEIGIRMALGAGRSGVVWLVLRGVLTLVLAGIAVGLPVAFASTRLVESYLWGIQPNDPLSIAGAVLVLATAAALAGYLPARRASRIDPMNALRRD